METCSSPNCIQFSTTYSINSPALGVLLIFLPRGQEQAAHQNPTYVMSSRSVTGTSLDPREVSDMPVGEYQVLAYDVEWNWDISPGGPAARGVVSVINGSSTGIIVLLQVFISMALYYVPAAQLQWQCRHSGHSGFGRTTSFALPK